MFSGNPWSPGRPAGMRWSTAGLLVPARQDGRLPPRGQGAADGLTPHPTRLRPVGFGVLDSVVSGRRSGGQVTVNLFDLIVRPPSDRDRLSHPAVAVPLLDGSLAHQPRLHPPATGHSSGVGRRAGTRRFTGHSRTGRCSSRRVFGPLAVCLMFTTVFQHKRPRPSPYRVNSPLAARRQ